jgi:hypothetical protein
MDNYRAELADTKIKLSVLVWYKAGIQFGQSKMDNQEKLAT